MKSYKPADEIVKNICLANYDNLAHANADFFRCVLDNSRPFQVCRNCKNNYTGIMEARETIQKDTHVYAKTLFRDGLTCEDIIEATDRVQLAIKIADTIDDIWSDSKCGGTINKDQILRCVRKLHNNFFSRLR
jgi:hypothetical protein